MPLRKECGALKRTNEVDEISEKGEDDQGPPKKIIKTDIEYTDASFRIGNKSFDIADPTEQAAKQFFHVSASASKCICFEKDPDKV